MQVLPIHFYKTFRKHLAISPEGEAIRFQMLRLHRKKPVLSTCWNDCHCGLHQNITQPACPISQVVGSEAGLN